MHVIMMLMDKDLSHLHEPAYNPRIIDQPDAANLEMSIKRFGDLSGIVFNRTTGNTVGGNQRSKELRRQKSKIVGLQEIEKNSVGTVARGWIQPAGSDEIFTYREVEWTLDFEKQANAAANRIQGRWDDKKLKIMLQDMDPDARQFTGFLEDEIDALFADDAKLDDDDDHESTGPKGPVMEIAADQDQQETINAAIYKCKAANQSAGTTITTAEALVQISTLYLQGQ